MRRSVGLGIDPIYPHVALGSCGCLSPSTLHYPSDLIGSRRVYALKVAAQRAER